MTVAERIATLVTPSTAALPEHERAAVIEIAFLAVSADRRIQPSEEEALVAFARALDPQHGRGRVEVLLARGLETNRQSSDAQLLEVAARLTTNEAKTLAYKAAYAVAQADLAAADEEFEFDLQLIDALGLTQDAADELAGEVVAALHPG
jgi:hypothetical protein